MEKYIRPKWDNSSESTDKNPETLATCPICLTDPGELRAFSRPPQPLLAVSSISMLEVRVQSVDDVSG